jgi:hypothetical protein
MIIHAIIFKEITLQKNVLYRIRKIVPMEEYFSLLRLLCMSILSYAKV